MAKEKPKSRQVMVLAYKADERLADDIKAWLDGLAAHVGAPVTVVVDMALKAFAEKQKYRAMPKRLGR